MNQYDGSIRISTKIDNGELDKGIKDASNGLKRFCNMALTAFQGTEYSAQKAAKKVESLTSKYEKQTQSVEKQKAAVENLRSKYDALVTGDTTPPSVRKMETDLKRVEAEIAKLDPQYEEMIAKYEKLQYQLDISKIAGSDTSVYESQIAEMDEQLMLMGERLDDLHMRADKFRSALSVKADLSQTIEAKKLASDIDLAVSKLNRLSLDAQKTKAILTGALAVKNSGLINTLSKVRTGFRLGEASIKSFTRRLMRIASSVLVFNLVWRSLRKLTNYMGNALKTNDWYVASLQSIKSNLLTAFQPIMESVLPAIRSLLDGMSKFTAYMAVVINKLFGKTAKSSQDAAASIYNQAKALDKTGKAAEKAKKSLAAFDELNVLSNDTDTESSDNTVAPTFSTDFDNTITDEVKSKFDTITLIASGALLALGAILTFTGANIGLGIGLMILGAAGLAAVVAVNWQTIEEQLQGPIGGITALISGALLVLGAVLAFSGAAIGLGIGLMVAGAAGLATTVAVNWETIKEKLQGPIGGITALVGGALLALGAILAFSGAGIGLGIGLMLAGAVALGTTAAVNWDIIRQKMQGPVGGVTALAGGALLALGAILLFTGVGIPLGLGLILAGAASLGTAIAFNWNTIPDKLSGVWNKIIDGLKGFINKFIGGIEWLVNKVIGGINWLIGMLNKISFDVPDWVPLIGGKTLGFDIKALTPVSLPRLAQGAVIPPNREFLAVLGDQKSGMNIETPLETMIQAFKKALADIGIGGNQQGDIYVFIGNEQLDSHVVRVVRASGLSGNGRVLA